jgi:hypothetical protein
MDSTDYKPPKPSPMPSDYDLYLASLTSQELELHKMAEELLGSSFFVEWTHGYKKWKATVTATANANSSLK